MVSRLLHLREINERVSCMALRIGPSCTVAPLHPILQQVKNNLRANRLT